MRKINGKLFLYELKKTFLLPSILAELCVLLNFIDLLFFRTEEGAGVGDYDKWAKWFLYIFYAIVMGVFIYRTFTTRKLYEKIRVSKEKLFWIRTLYIFAYCFIFTTVLTLVGTMNLAIANVEQYGEWQKIIKTSVFAYQGKSAWYFLFGASVGMTGAITYSVIVFAQNIICSGERWYLKIFWSVAFMGAIFSTHFVISRTFTFPGLGTNEYFATPIPFGGMTYAMYENYFFHSAQFDPSIALGLVPELLCCDICWNIANPWVLLSGLFVIVFAFLSIGVLYREENVAYSYVSQKEERQ